MGAGTELIHGSDWGAAFRNKPILLKTNQEVSAFLEGKIKKNMVMQEDTCTLSTNDSYRNRNTTYEIPNSEKGSTFLGFGFLMRDETSSIKGRLDSTNDVDFYNFTIPYNRTLQNHFEVEIYMELPEGCKYTMTLYDEYGNQVGKAEGDGGNRKSLTIPNWDTSTNRYCIRIENENGEEISPDDYYKIGCHILEKTDTEKTDTEKTDTEKTDAIRDAYGAWQTAKSRGLPNQQEYLDRYNALLQEAEADYAKEVEALHQKQYESLPKEQQYKGGKTAEELLRDLADGRELNEAEQEYLKIFANLSDFEKAKQKAGLKNNFSQEFVRELERQGISKDDIEGMNVRISGSGAVTVDGIKDEAVRKQVESLIQEKYGDPMYQYYIGIADSIGNLSPQVYEYATEIQEVMRYLKGAAGQDIDLKDLYLTADGRIGGLPEKVGDMVNHTKNNAKIDRIKDMLTDIIQKIGRHQAIPYFSSAFQFSGGELQVADTGFAADTDTLEKELSPSYARSQAYRYKFRRVL